MKQWHVCQQFNQNFLKSTPATLKRTSGPLAAFLCLFPLFAGLHRLCYLLRKYLDLKGKFDRLQRDYDRVREGNARLSDRLMEVRLENKKLRQISADYTRVKRVFGPEQVEAAVEADKQREQAEKGRKRPRRSLDRGGR